MPHRHRRKTCRRGGGYQTSQQMFDPDVKPPVAGMFAPVVSTAPTAADIRPVLHSTFQAGAGRRRSTRRLRGGFSPSVMGGFIPNAQAAIVPAALYMVYRSVLPKNKNKKGGSRRRATQRRSRRRN